MIEPKDRHSIRDARAWGTAPIAAPLNRAFQIEKFFVDGERITEEEVRRLIDNGRFLVSEDAEGEARAVTGCVYVESGGEHCYLGLLSVSPSRQREGLGRQLVAAAEEYA